jgi:hypothetical protein
MFRHARAQVTAVAVRPAGVPTRQFSECGCRFDIMENHQSDDEELISRGHEA